MIVGVTQAAGVVLAGGSGTRVGREINKVYLPIAGRPVLAWSLEAFASHPGIGPVVLVTRPQDVEHVQEVTEGLDVEVVSGGSTRQGSELAALRQLAGRINAGEVDTVLIHDGARPLVSRELVAAVLRAARQYGGAIPGMVSEDLALATDEHVIPISEELVAVQTPQGFLAAPLLAAYERAAEEGFVGTDTASCIERFTDIEVHWVPGEQRNIKITFGHDLVVAERILESR
ncbi:2-C-methyl-D-erythritol 4-phosphate cytidylyltransferase [Kibdelosporangium persicum]|uniref:2-C-methyl-D-erythritol 4-phosphate cytidylyltransferase n=1 Tax=Kibdelosporangium persicum TaxID=2698649 RepID=A0ABX2EZA3_9PSEU|nr:2-C-methyl-D-erythritol 4-phosphate cytidylyltransferase [Kibdelosporangium persicum]NRN63990.1 2-C-methyl-D-erythritol 4-phosphate cytidylyltransferase [Kibdelosporangium persicum]